ncbi:MAG: hypothetical protein RBT65_07220 [Methanolobus sp.]|nr:hypothetical protein [Methanolobus sp.]
MEDGGWLYPSVLPVSGYACIACAPLVEDTATTAPSSDGGSGKRGDLIIREANKTDGTVESTGEDNTEGKSTENIGSVSFKINSNGETLGDVTVWSNEETAYLSISSGTKATDSSGGYVSRISIVNIPPTTDLPKMEDAMALQAYECTPQGTTFSPAISLTFTLNEEEWKQYGESAKVGWYNDNTGEWEIIQGTAAANTRTITIQISHFSKYALFGDDTGEIVTDTQETGAQSSTSMYWLWIILLLGIVGGAGYYITQVKRKD